MNQTMRNCGIHGSCTCAQTASLAQIDVSQPQTEQLGAAQSRIDQQRLHLLLGQGVGDPPVPPSVTTCDRCGGRMRVIAVYRPAQ